MLKLNKIKINERKLSLGEAKVIFKLFAHVFEMELIIKELGRKKKMLINV